MKRIYIIYSNNDGELELLDISKTLKEAKKHYKKSILPGYLTMGMDDLHSIILEKVNVTIEQYEILQNYLSNQDNKLFDQVKKLLTDIVNSPDTDTIYIGTSDDNIGIFNLFLKTEHPDVEKYSDEYFDLETELVNNYRLYKKYLTYFIKQNY